MKIKFNIGGIFSIIAWYKWYHKGAYYQMSAFPNTFFPILDKFIIEYSIPKKPVIDEFGQVTTNSANLIAEIIPDIFHKL